MDSSLLKRILKFHGVSETLSWDDTATPPSKRAVYEKAIANSPPSGLLLVNGTASPVMIDYLNAGKKISAIDYLEYYDSALSKEEFEFPPIKDDHVVLIYNVGLEPSIKSYDFTSKLLHRLLKRYQGGIVVIQSNRPLMKFNVDYSTNIVNYMQIPLKSEAVWV